MRALCLGAVVVATAYSCGRSSPDAARTSAATEVATATTIPSVPSFTTEVAAEADASSSTSAAETQVSTPRGAVRISVDQACPTSIAGSPGVVNSDRTGLANDFVAGTPTAAVVCRYATLEQASVDANGRELAPGALFSETRLGPAEAKRLGAAANAIGTNNSVTGGQPVYNNHRYTAMAFAVPGRSDIDLWLDDTYGVPGLTNGFRDSGQMFNRYGKEFLDLLDDLAPPAPAVEGH